MSVRSQNDIALALASSGIAAILLPGGRTAHCTLKLPFNIQIIEIQSIRHGKNPNWLSERAILAAKNKDVYQLNNIIQSRIQNETVTYKSVDTVVEVDETVNYPTEFLNSLDLPGMPIHILQLKVGVSIIMLRNINQPKLCKGTRFAVKKLMSNVIEATILTGPFNGEDLLIPRIPMIPTDMPLQFEIAIPNSINICNHY
ncbi:ATP-dependent DNA helicase [Trichonephila clavipes]|nr:ATP-dependent DNA helicase [Trichonephila clavipes]